MNRAREGAAVVPAIRAPNSVALLRSLGRRGVHTIAVSEHERPPSFRSRYVDERVAVPTPGENIDGYREELLALARRDDVRAIFPVREADVYALSTDRSSFADHVAPLWPTAEALRAVHDRSILFDVAERAGVDVPETRLLTEVEDWDRERIVKGRFAILVDEFVETVRPGMVGSPPKTIFLEPGTEPYVDSIVDEMGHVPIAQEYVRGTEYCLRALYHDGEPVVTTQKRLRRGYKYSRGPSVYHEAVDIPELRRAGLRLLEELQWEGIASVGFIRDDAGQFNLLEINPRFPASIPVDIHAGVDYPAYVWDLATDGPLETPPDYRPGTASHLLRGEIAHLHSVLFEDYPMVERPGLGQTLWDIASSTLRQPNFDLASLDDPGPFVRDTWNAVRGTVGRPSPTIAETWNTVRSTFPFR
ncbi:MAG: ATP-grasp domain-containing protein [Halanaeroarchaeum sp.]